jgi:hypothetical protein
MYIFAVLFLNFVQQRGTVTRFENPSRHKHKRQRKFIVAMRKLLLIILFCTLRNVLLGQTIREQNDPKRHPSLTNKTTIQQLKGKPIEYYLNHKGIGETAKLFYKGQYAIYDDEGTFSIIDSVLTNNVDTQPFYFFIFNEILNISDGAISEYMSSRCTNYVRKFPCDFLRYSSDLIFELDLGKWTSFIGFDLYDKKNYEEFNKTLDVEIKRDCSSMTTKWNEIKMKIKGNLPR